jgi:polyferredoxin
MNTKIFSQRYPAWVMLLSFLPVIIAIALPFLPLKGREFRFWTTDYIIFLNILLLIPPLLLTRKSNYIRALILLFAVAYFGFLQKACPRPPGAIEQILINISGTRPILMHVIKMGLLMITALIFSRYYCGWICPKGIIQEYLYRPEIALRIPVKLDKLLKYIKYIMLILLIAFPLFWHIRLFRHIGPFKVIFNLDGPMLLVIFLVVVLVASIFIERAYCRYLCPEGALLALLAYFSPLKVRVNADDCTKCQKCAKICPTDAISMGFKEIPKIHYTECIACKRCEEVCPKGGIAYGAKHKIR